MKILIVGGTFDLNGGRESSLIEKLYLELSKYNSEIVKHNGGDYDLLESIIDSSKNFEVTFWLANVPNDLPKIRNVKKVNPYTLLVGSKRNDNKYSFVEVLNRSLEQRNNLTIQFTKVEDKLFKMLLFDPLGTSWYDGTSMEEMVKVLYERISFLLTTRRANTFESNKYIEIPNNEDFFEYTRYAASVFHKTIEHEDGVTRFLGNSSFIDENRKYVYVTRRDVDKEFIDRDHFVATFMEDGKVYYSKNKDGKFYKPSKDTIVQSNLYEKFPNINFIVHSHCYIKNAPFTKLSVPCGSLDEIDEVMEVIENNFEGDFNKNYYPINLKGHGCLILGKEISLLKETSFVTRHLPERWES